MTSDQQRFEEILESISRGSTSDTKVSLASLRPSEIAGTLEANHPETRRIIWGLIDEENRSQTLQHLHDDVRAEFLEAMDTAQLVSIAEDLDTDDFADILRQLPETISARVL